MKLKTIGATSFNSTSGSELDQKPKKLAVYAFGIFKYDGYYADEKIYLQGSPQYINHNMPNSGFKPTMLVHVVAPNEAAGRREAHSSYKRNAYFKQYKKLHSEHVSYTVHKCSLHDLWSYEELLTRGAVVPKP